MDHGNCEGNATGHHHHMAGRLIQTRFRVLFHRRPCFAAYAWSAVLLRSQWRQCFAFGPRRVAVRKIAVAVETTDPAVEPERKEYALHRAGQELAHRKHRTADREWRQDIEHGVVFGFTNLNHLPT
ncbi:hypothetical protein EV128_1391 [Rhizobium azibense]|nr:hypothetical protein EV128_1391 [Rhizobium azibense]